MLCPFQFRLNLGMELPLLKGINSSMENIKATCSRSVMTRAIFKAVYKTFSKPLCLIDDYTDTICIVLCCQVYCMSVE